MKQFKVKVAPKNGKVSVRGPIAVEIVRLIGADPTKSVIRPEGLKLLFAPIPTGTPAVMLVGPITGLGNTEKCN